MVHALIVGAILMAGGVWVMFMIPHPLWFRAIGIVCFLPGAWLGARLAPSLRA